MKTITSALGPKKWIVKKIKPQIAKCPLPCNKIDIANGAAAFYSI
jgi:hypothetical protein